MNTEKQNFEQGLIGAGFITYEIDSDEFKVPVFKLHNDLGVYIGELLVNAGFAKTEEIERGKTWTTFTSDFMKISHRSLSESPECNTFSIDQSYPAN